jgi:glycosyltransferase involved in cell wall biosynthesis
LIGKKLVLFMGRIHPKKGCDLLIEAFAKVLGTQPDWHLVIAGPDKVGWREKLEDRAAQLGLGPRLTWTGMLGGTIKWGALRAAEIFVLPSHQENFGIAVAEALAVSVPVLISNKVNIWREIECDRAGIVSEDTLEGTCKLLQSYEEMSCEKKQAMRRAATLSFEKRFEIKKAAQTLHAALVSATGAN